MKLPPSGSWYRYGSIPLGEIYYPKAEKRTIRVRAVEKSGAAVMNLKAVCLVPACEGKPPVQGDDGTITLHSRDATVHGVMLRYEPDPKKITLGYWVRPTDAASWQFEVRNPGEFEVEVHQGCGTGQGGSEVAVSLGDQKLTFVVEETGHFQNFKPRTIGRIKIPAAGWSELRVGPTKIAKGAALDIRQIILRPVTSASP